MSPARVHARTVGDVTHALRDRGATGARIFATSSAFPADRSLVWSGEDLGEFLALFQRMRGDVLYVRGEAAPPGRNGDTPVVHDLTWSEVAFLHEGLFHVFRNPTHEPAATPAVADGLKVRGPELLQGFLSSAQAEAPDPATPKVRALLLGHLARAFGVGPGELAEAARRDDAVGASLDALEELARAALREREQAAAEALAGACAAWAKEQGQKSVTQGDVDAFLAERKAKLGKDARRVLWRKANAALKKG